MDQNWCKHKNMLGQFNQDNFHAVIHRLTTSENIAKKVLEGEASFWLTLYIRNQADLKAPSNLRRLTTRLHAFQSMTDHPRARYTVTRAVSAAGCKVSPRRMPVQRTHLWSLAGWITEMDLSLLQLQSCSHLSSETARWHFTPVTLTLT